MTELRFDTIEQLSEAFKSQTFESLPENININDEFHYYYKHYGDTNNTINLMDFKQLVENNTSTWLMYTLKASDLDKLKKMDDSVPFEETLTTPHQLLLFGWKPSQLSLQPTRCISVSRNRSINVSTLAENTRPVIGKHVNIKLPQLGNIEIEAKIDTGAGQCCLHATNVKSTGDSITFEFEGKRITMNQAGVVEIQTADNGGDNRPVIKLDVVCEQGEFKDIEFNLNDRSDMPHKVLLGHNFIEKGQFLVDPLQEDIEEVDNEWIVEVVSKYL